MNFLKYPHVENTNRDEVEGIEIGTTYIFPKLDGSNASVWREHHNGSIIQCGSRNRILENLGDLQGFYNYVQGHLRLHTFFAACPYYRLYGEWLVPHTLKTYQDDAWKKFYIFDVYHNAAKVFLSYEDYKPMLERFDLEYIPCIKEIKNGNTEQFIDIVTKSNTYLIKDGMGVGEGIVIKNYEYRNKYGRQCFAKLKTNDFLADHHKKMGHPVTEQHPMEAEVVDKLLTCDTINKVYVNLCHGETDMFDSKLIPRLLETIWHDFIIEEMYRMCKQFKNPTIDFKKLKAHVIASIKATIPEAFGGVPLNKGY